MTDFNIEKIFELQNQGYVVTKDNYKELVRAYDMLQASKVAVAQVPVAKAANSDAPVDFPQYSPKKIAEVRSNPSKTPLKKGGTKTIIIPGAALQLRLSQGNGNKLSIIHSDTAALIQAGITGRTELPSRILKDVKMDPMIRSALEKIGASLQDKTKQTRVSASVIVGDLVFEFKSVGDKNINKFSWTITDIINIKLLPGPVIAASKLAAQTGHLTLVTTSAITPAAPVVATPLSPFTMLLAKNDAWLTSDDMLGALGYHPSIDVTQKNREDLRSRIVEYAYSKQLTILDWVNDKSEKFKSYDYTIKGTSKTVDIKTVTEFRSNLAIDVDNVENNTMSDAYSLALIEDAGSNWKIHCYGFISKETVLKYIKAIPNSLMPSKTWYKIDKKMFDRAPFTS